MKMPKVEDLTLREKIGQTVIFRQMLLEELDTMDKVEEYFKNNVVGSYWLTGGHPREVYRVFEEEIGNPELKGYKDHMHINLLNKLNDIMPIPMFPAIDAQNGIPPSKFEEHGELPNCTSLGATRDPELAYRYAKSLGDDLYSIGFRWIWSPVADNAGKFKGLRHLSADRDNNEKLLAAMIRGFHDAGIATGAKHFPGADPYEYRDSHFCTAAYSESYETWEKTQGREFKACIDAGVDSIMVGHKVFKAIDDTMVNGNYLPCTLSYKVVTELIKGKLGFEGVVLTDDVRMKSLATMYSPDKLYVELLKAGIDMVLAPTTLDYVDVVERAVLSGELPESRIDDACRRILKMKEKYGYDIGEKVPYPTEERRNEIRESIHAVSHDIAEKGITITANKTGIIPVNPDKIRKVKVIYIGYSDECYKNLSYMADEFRRHGAECVIQDGIGEADNKKVSDFDQAKAVQSDYLDDYDLIVYATFIGMHAPKGAPYFFEEKCYMMTQVMTVGKEKSVGVSFGNPNIYFNYFTAAYSFVNAYSYNRETMECFVKGLYGDIQFTDYSPFPLNPIFLTNDVY